MEWLRRIADVPALRPGTPGAYLLAILSAVIALTLRVAIDPYVTGVQYVTFFPAVIVTTLLCGLAAGLVCLMLSVAAVAFFVLPPRFSFTVGNVSDVLTTFLFILVTLCIVILITGTRSALERYQELSQRLKEHETALRDREDRLAVMVAELQHRTRNLISVVGAIADDTIRTSSTLDDFKARYHDRLAVLGRAQGLLYRTREGGRVTFDELLNSELAAQSIAVADDHGAVTLDGPAGIGLRSGTVQTLAMVLHELVANAVKHGALSRQNGRLTIRWRREVSPENGKPWLHLDWKETGVEMPTQADAGKGREMIERALPYQCGARTKFDLDADGVHCTILLPASEHAS